MKKRAKVHIEIEYDSLENGEIDMENMNIVKCDAIGDYEGLTLAMTTGLAFGAPKGQSAKETFAIKLRLLRSTASALANCINILKMEGAISKEDLDDSLSQRTQEVVRTVVNIITLGIGRVLGISNDYIDELNEEEYKDPNGKQDGKQEGKQQGDKGTGLESDGLEDYL